MVIRALAENTSVSEEYGSEHGLSLYIETENHKLLFDMGRGNLFLENAQKMGVDISDVDIAVISHGHLDHGGGIKYFLDVNKKAKIYLQRHAFEHHYSTKPNGDHPYIGLDESLKDNSRFIFTDDYFRIDSELEVFSNVTGREFWSKSNDVLLMESGGHLVADAFAHEQNLVVTQGEKKVLIAGCAHNGIVKIIKKFASLEGKQADVVIGGFHLFNPTSGTTESPELIAEIAEALSSYPSTYYTCHCTGQKAFNLLHDAMGDRMRYLSTGACVQIDS